MNTLGVARISVPLGIAVRGREKDVFQRLSVLIVHLGNAYNLQEKKDRKAFHTLK